MIPMARRRLAGFLLPLVLLYPLAASAQPGGEPSAWRGILDAIGHHIVGPDAARRGGSHRDLATGFRHAPGDRGLRFAESSTDRSQELEAARQEYERKRHEAVRAFARKERAGRPGEARDEYERMIAEAEHEYRQRRRALQRYDAR